MKKTVTIIILMLMLFTLVACVKKDNTAKDNNTTTSQTDTNKTENINLEETNTKENLQADADVTLDFLNELEQIYVSVGNIQDGYNDGTISTEDTVTKLNTEKDNLEKIITTVNITTWKSYKYESNRSHTLQLATEGFNKFFDSVIKGLSEESDVELLKADNYLSDYEMHSSNLLKDVNLDIENQ